MMYTLYKPVAVLPVGGGGGGAPPKQFKKVIENEMVVVVEVRVSNITA